MHIVDQIRSLLQAVPAELAQHPTIARGIGEFVQDKINSELKGYGVPYQIGVQFTGPAEVATQPAPSEV